MLSAGRVSVEVDDDDDYDDDDYDDVEHLLCLLL